MPAAGYTALSRVATSDCYLLGGHVTREHIVPANKLETSPFVWAMPARCTWTFRGCRPLATRRSAAWRRRTATCSAATSRASTSCRPCRLVSYRKNVFRRRESLPDRELCLCAKKRSRRTTRGGSLCHVGARLEVLLEINMFRQRGPPTDGALCLCAKKRLREVTSLPGKTFLGSASHLHIERFAFARKKRSRRATSLNAPNSRFGWPKTRVKSCLRFGF